MNKHLYRLIAVGICFPLGCVLKDDVELVMTPGEIIEVANRQGKIRVEAVGRFKRTYTWHGKSKTFQLRPRYGRWYGSKGAGRPVGDSSMHAVLEEGQQHFTAIEEVYPWLVYQSSNGRNEVTYTSDGLVVVWEAQHDKSGEGFTALLVDVWQIYINGEKPRNLAGARDAAVNRVCVGEGSVAIGKPVLNVARSINGRKYSGKVLDLMEEKKMKPEKVEELMSKAQAKPNTVGVGYSGWAGEDASLHFSVWLNAAGDVVYICM